MDGTMHTVDNASSYRYRFVNEYASSGKYTMYGLETYVRGCAAHALHDLIPRAEYSVNHPEWYPDGTQLCLSKQDLFDEFIKKITEALDTDRVGYRISLGQEDGFTRWCGCPACSDEQNRYGGTGYWLRFCNKVVNKVEEWIAENQPGREIKYSAFCVFDGLRASRKRQSRANRRKLPSARKNGYPRMYRRFLPLSRGRRPELLYKQGNTRKVAGLG